MYLLTLMCFTLSFVSCRGPVLLHQNQPRGLAPLKWHNSHHISIFFFLFRYDFMGSYQLVSKQFVPRILVTPQEMEGLREDLQKLKIYMLENMESHQRVMECFKSTITKSLDLEMTSSIVVPSQSLPRLSYPRQHISKKKILKRKQACSEIKILTRVQSNVKTTPIKKKKANYKSLLLSAPRHRRQR